LGESAAREPVGKLSERDSVDLGRRIREARRGAGLTQTALAEKLGLRLWHVERFESGNVPKEDELGKIAAAVGRPLSWFHGEEPEDATTPTARASGEGIRVLFETRLAARRPVSERPVSPPALEPAYRWRADELKRQYETLLEQQDPRSGWRRLLRRDGDGDPALPLLAKAIELEAEWSRHMVEVEAELARTRMREERLSDALSAALHASDSLVNEAREEAHLVLRKARRQATRMLAEGARGRSRAEREVERLRGVLNEAGAVSRRMAESLERLEAATGAPSRHDESVSGERELVDDLLPDERMSGSSTRTPTTDP
jgi:transcriptional regulator with XRE-family HTH domain